MCYLLLLLTMNNYFANICLWDFAYTWRRKLLNNIFEFVILAFIYFLRFKKIISISYSIICFREIISYKIWILYSPSIFSFPNLICILNIKLYKKHFLFFIQILIISLALHRFISWVCLLFLLTVITLQLFFNLIYQSFFHLYCN